MTALSDLIARVPGIKTVPDIGQQQCRKKSFPAKPVLIVRRIHWYNEVKS
jgi:hypothetical protein